MKVTFAGVGARVPLAVVEITRLSLGPAMSIEHALSATFVHFEEQPVRAAPSEHE